MERTLFEGAHDQFRQSFRSWLAEHVVPYESEWSRLGIVPRSLFTKAGEMGFLGMAIPEELGGGGVSDFRFNQVMAEEIQASGVIGCCLGLTLQNDICLPYFLRYCTPEQSERWLPGIASGELITAIAMSEPSMGSDLASMLARADRDGDDYLVNGQKTFVTNGINADLVITAVKTDPKLRHKGISLLVIERGMKGFDRGRNLEKIGQHAQDTAELFFTDVHVPEQNLLGIEGEGFSMLMTNLAQERLSMAVSGIAGARAAMEWTLDYVKNRIAFDQPIGSFQNSRFILAETATEIEIGQTFVDRCVTFLNEGQLSSEDAAMAKWWSTELQNRTVDRCLQLHGGYGYMTESAIARAYIDSRITTIYGGTTEIMKEIIGRAMGL
jgi:alkylation response protein AidB-like acyl-CoA dehydrogenase